MPTESKIQAFVHKLEEGGWAFWLRLATLVVAVLAMAYLWLFGANGFSGLADQQAFEQAEIAREIARGNGFTTKFFRPAALYQFRELKGSFSADRTPDTYHAPLWPLILAPCLWLERDSWEMTTKEVLYVCDRVVAVAATVCFLLALVVNYFLARRLFDHRLAVIGIGLLLVCSRLWHFAMSGLPQMLMLLLFSCAMYALLRAIEAAQPAAAEPDEIVAEEEEFAEDPEVVVEPELAPPAAGRFSLRRGPLPWLLAVAVLFGLLALTHGLTIWIFAGVLLFCALHFRAARSYALIMLAVFSLCYAPWLWRNYRACGSPFGIAWYTALHQVRGTESAIMRSMDPPLSGLAPYLFRRKVIDQVQVQLGDLYLYLGGIVVAPFFFISLLHLFRRRPTASFRWVVLFCWLAALFGMALFGVDNGGYGASDLHLLFIPLLTFYGLAFLLVLWSRLEVRVRLAQVAFMFLLFAATGFPFFFEVLDMLARPGARVQWPPYIPPYIAILRTWTKDREIIMSDMPWAVAWYADRRSLWLPGSVNDYLQLNDWDVLEGRIIGMHLTPVSGNMPFLNVVVKGEYKEWAPFIMRNANLRNFPLKAWTPLPKDNMCVFYADRDRWSARED